MRINAIRLRNYRKFRNVSLEFGDGIISINGLNGAGKSTLVEAIAWALYGNDKRILRDSKEGVKYAGAGPGEICSVELEFELKGDNYRVVREMRGKAGTMVAEISQNGMVQASSDRDVRNFVEKRLGVDAEGFLISVFARQKELNALSLLTKEARNRKIENMLGLDAIDVARKFVSEDRRMVGSALDTMRAILYTDDGRPVLDTLKDEAVEKEKEIADMKKGLAAAEKEHSEIEKELSAQKDVLSALEKKKSEAERLKASMGKESALLSGKKADVERISRELSGISLKKKELESLSGIPEELSERKKELEGMRESREHLMRLEELKKRRERVRKEFLRLKERIEQDESDLKDMRSQLPDITALKDERKRLDAEKEEMAEKRNSLDAEKKRIERDIKGLEKAMKEIDGLGPKSKCPTCHRPLGKEYHSILQHMQEEKEAYLKELDAVKEEMNALDEKISGISLKIKDVEDRIRAAERMMVSIENLESRISEKKAEKERAESELSEIESRIEGIGEVSFDEGEFEFLKKRIDELTEMERRYTRLSAEVSREGELKKRLEELRSEIEGMESRISAMRSEMESLGFSEEEMESARAKYEELSGKERELHGKMSALRARISSEEERLAGIYADMERREKEMQDMALKEEEFRYLAKLEKLMKDFRGEAISSIRPMLEAIASDFFTRMTDGKYAGIELDEDYEIKIIDAGRAYTIKRFSGGESDLANLCLRLAISDVVIRARGAGGFNFLVLDEIFGSQDEIRRENIIRALQSLQNRFSQIFLISHIEGIKESASMVIKVRETEDGDSVVEI